MDSETKTLLLVLLAVAGGAAIGWCIKQQMRRVPSSTGTARKAAAVDDGPSFIPVDAVSPGSAPCGGCRQ